MKKLLPVFIGCIFMFQPANETTSQVKGKVQRKPDSIVRSNPVLKDNLEIKSDSVLKVIDEIKQTVEDKPVVKWMTRWKTKIVIQHDTVCQCPVDTLGYTPDEPEVIFKHDTIIIYKHDTIKLKNKTIWQKLKDIF